jgi:hypothetical protein
VPRNVSSRVAATRARATKSPGRVSRLGVLKALLDEHPQPVAVKNLAADPDNWSQTWDIVQRLAEEQVPLVELGQSEGDDRSNVPITLTPEGKTVAHTI